MPGLIAHCIFAMVMQAILGYSFGFPLLSHGIFVSGIISMLIDMDHLEIPPHRTPITHSIIFAPFWIYIIWMFSYIIMPSVSLEILLSGVSAFTTHMLMDAFTKGGIYTYPRVWKIREIFEPLALGKDVESLSSGKYILRINYLRHAAVMSGDAGWKAWNRFPSRLISRHYPSSSSEKLNAIISFIGIILIAIIIVLG